MTSVRLVVRAQHRADTLERISGALRRRGFAVERFSVSFVSAGGVEVVVTIDRNRTDPERVCRELLTLRDVIEIETTGADAEIRELLMASVASAGGEADARARMVQMLGAPEEIDAMVAWLESQNLMVRYVRSGEFAVPGPPVHPHRDAER